MSETARRTLATREAAWARQLAHVLGRAGVRPNAVSVAGLGFAVVAAAALVSAREASPTGAVTLLIAAAAIQLRLLCNLLDGLLAVEEGFKTPTGDLYNEIPDRLADVLILVAAGYAARHLPGAVALGWAAAVTALLTAYVRVLAGSLGCTQDFSGPMAKPHRMFTLTVATLASAVESLAGGSPRALRVGLAIIVAGSIVTAGRRTLRLAAEARRR